MIREKPEGVRDVPKPTRFTYPDGTRIEGQVIKEVGKKRTGIVAGDYYFVIQLIKYPEDDEKYVKDGGYDFESLQKTNQYIKKTLKNKDLII